MELHKVNGAWDVNTKWSNQPTTTFVRTLAAPVAAGPYEIDVTDLFNSGALANGIELRPTSNNNNFNRFASGNHSDATIARPGSSRRLPQLPPTPTPF